jgi:hypothetical protein
LLPNKDFAAVCAEQHDEIRQHACQLGDQPRPACHDLSAAGRLVNSALSLLGARELEVLDRVRHVDLLAIDSRIDERLVEQLARGADERGARAV